MKKILAIVFALVFALSFAACGEAYTLKGKWKAPVTVDSAAGDGDYNYVLLEFKANGNGTITEVNLDQIFPSDFTYTVNDDAMAVTSKSGKNVECEYKIEGDTLVITTQSTTVEYTRYFD